MESEIALKRFSWADRSLDVSGIARTVVVASAAGVSSPGKAQRVDLQHRLPVLLLSFQGSTVSKRKEPDVGGYSRAVHPAIIGIAPYARSHSGMAGWRADLDETRLLQALD